MQPQTQYPVSAEFHGQDTWSSPGVDFSDYTRMSTYTKKLAPNRRLATPPWALNDEMLRGIIVRFVEARANIKDRKQNVAADDLKSRLAAAQARMAERRPLMIRTLDGLCRAYVTVKNSESPEAECLRKLEVEIENYDTQLRINDDIAAKLAGVVHLYYRMGLDSVAVAQELNLKPPHVRMMCHKMWQVAKSLGYQPESVGYRKVPARKRKTIEFEAKHGENIVAWYSEGVGVEEIAKRCGSGDTRVRGFLRRAGVYEPKRPMPRPQHEQVVKEFAAKNGDEVCKLHLSGWTIPKIAKHYGTSRDRIRRILIDAGIYRDGRIRAGRKAA